MEGFETHELEKSLVDRVALTNSSTKRSSLVISMSKMGLCCSKGICGAKLPGLIARKKVISPKKEGGGTFHVFWGEHCSGLVAVLSTRAQACLLLFCPGATLAPAAGLGAGIQTDQGQESGKGWTASFLLCPRRPGLQEATWCCLQEAGGGGGRRVCLFSAVLLC